MSLQACDGFTDEFTAFIAGHLGILSVQPDDLAIYKKLESPVFGALVHAVHVVGPVVDADLTAARLFDGQDDATRIYADASRLCLSPAARDTVNQWPTTHGSLFDFAAKQTPTDQAFRPSQLIDTQSPAWQGIFKPLDQHTSIVDTFCITCPIADNAWCMFAFMRCGSSKPFAPRDTDTLERLKPSLIRLVRSLHQRRPRTGDGNDASNEMPADPSALLSKLSQTERHILQLLLTGHTERKIGQTLHRSPHTVHVHVKNTYRKLGVNSRRQLQDLFGS